MLFCQKITIVKEHIPDNSSELRLYPIILYYRDKADPAALILPGGKCKATCKFVTCTQP